MSRRVIGIFLCMVLAVVQVQFLGTVSASAAVVQPSVAACSNVVNSEHSLKINKGIAPKHKSLSISSNIKYTFRWFANLFKKISLFAVVGVLIGCAIGYIACQMVN